MKERNIKQRIKRLTGNMVTVFLCRISSAVLVYKHEFIIHRLPDAWKVSNAFSTGKKKEETAEANKPIEKQEKSLKHFMICTPAFRASLSVTFFLPSKEISTRKGWDESEERWHIIFSLFVCRRFHIRKVWREHVHCTVFFSVFSLWMRLRLFYQKGTKYQRR